MEYGAQSWRMGKKLSVDERHAPAGEDHVDLGKKVKVVIDRESAFRRSHEVQDVGEFAIEDLGID